MLINRITIYLHKFIYSLKFYAIQNKAKNFGAERRNKNQKLVKNKIILIHYLKLIFFFGNLNDESM